MYLSLDEVDRRMAPLDLFRVEKEREPQGTNEFEAWRRVRYTTERDRVLSGYLDNGDAANDRSKVQKRSSLYGRLLRDMADAAMRHAFATNATLDEYEDAIESGAQAVDALSDALTDYDNRDNPAQRWNFWRHDPRPGQTIRQDRIPQIDRSGVEAAIERYLDLPYRAPYFERTLVDVLVAMELFAFGNEFFVPFPWLLSLWIIPRSPIQQWPTPITFIVGQATSALMLLGPAWLVAKYGPAIIGRSPADWISGALLVLILLGLVVGLIALPIAWWGQIKGCRRVRRQLMTMAQVYAELGSDGPISTRRIRDAATHAANNDGIVWPPPLFAVLDDNIARDGRL
jgi:hypothetical protein